jgi:hypothetical protein
MSEVPSAVQTLINHSLVQPRDGESGEARFAMLETIHAYAREQLTASGEATELSRQHAAYFRALALDAEAAIEGPQRAAWLRRIGQDHDNLLRALEWATRNSVVETSLWLVSGGDRCCPRCRWAANEEPLMVRIPWQQLAYHQQEQEYYCGAACAQMLLHSRSVGRPSLKTNSTTRCIVSPAL